MIVLDDIDHLYRPGTICAKAVDFPNPNIRALKKIFTLAGFDSYPQICRVDCIPEPSFSNNLYGGLDVIPGNLSKSLCEKWKIWALFLLANINLLASVGKKSKVDQVAFSLARHDLGIRVHNRSRKHNYPADDSVSNRGYPAIPHSHKCLSKAVYIISTGNNDHQHKAAITEANALIAQSLKNKLVT